MNYRIAKNKDTFGKIKLAKKIYLTKKVEDRNGEWGLSTEKFGKQWFVTPKGKALFKTYDLEHDLNDGYLRLENELISNRIAKQLGLSVAEYEPAQYQIFEGLASYDYQKDGDRVVDAHKLLKMANSKTENLVEFLEAVKIINQQGVYKIDVEKMESDLFKMIVFDSLTFQEDRGLQNILFLLNESNKTIRMAPITDNEFAFGGFQGNVVFNEKGIDREYFLSNHSHNILFTIKPMQYNGTKSKYIKSVMDIVEYASKRPKLKEFLKTALTTINYKQAIQSINETGNIVPNDYELVLLEYEKLAKDIYKKAIQKFKSQEMGLN